MKKIPKTRIRKIRTWIPKAKAGRLLENINDKQFSSLLDLASNDYLGLSQHPNLIEAAKETMIAEGLGAGGSRLVTGSRPIHQALEKELSQWLNFESVLLFPSGFQANLAAVTTLANRKTPVIADKLIHHSLLVGIKASGAKLKRFSHNDINDLEKLIKISLKESPTQTPLVITESVFSMEGSSPDLEKIGELCNNYHAMLLVDEAHSLGVMGDQGRGLCYGLKNPVTMISGTFGKAFGGGGAFLATSDFYGEHIVQTSGAFRYTTALAPPLAAAALEALKLIKDNPGWGLALQKKSSLWRSTLIEHGWNVRIGNSPIIPLVLGSDEESLKKQTELEANGILTVAIRPPTVPEGTSRLRIVVRNNLPGEVLEQLLFYLGKKV
ncbi:MULTISPECIES: aminotransferase class I/II-fold pyridoxal phosphate-dependent enzyme [Prochlorococcus]|uniref:8-amino-7-oxononanoate synthase n=1 Tax=Prochlorococcus marinus (strain SARG / CCMP1375 / SS120) TaxID=167539 RepID=Q7VA45_PROMA|nr:MULTISPECIES: aminotransferase class I/II-fold pyridoxal phosphate-dependent enzyme [Prochlorococcus]AAQ00666.1 7-keto-8-aminopelargonate synthetase [Prochlorococcus marinus subsp. marinus str. CCMP1375]KGG10839.1 8-amino-7-oxononanoate synthase [Prochlorococcus marinus str. LG]KGG20418.1 8-amino-7-oxononanoate synthase [Prochlorococcus marinus str. SS2]KGG24087.1 8-amino-7-oxononanoate synthase [Prochlorococcus marinus str. SS35]KGG31654.1 8-amino-7-oxononanoate synthase [Prochlorococcus m